MTRPTRLSERGMKRIADEEWTGTEGLRNGLFFPYRDYVQAKNLSGWTIGIGCLVRPGEDYSRGLTMAEIVELFHARMADVYAAIQRNVSYELNQSMFDALCDAGHNLGPGFFNPESSHPIAALNARDLEGFASESCDGHCATSGKPAHLQDYNRSELGFDKNLLARRRAERVWFFEPPPTEETDTAPPIDLTQIERDADDAAREDVHDTEPSPPPDVNS